MEPRFKLKGHEQEVSEAYCGGESTPEIGKRFGVSHASIIQCLDKTGTPRRSRSEALKKTHCERGHVKAGSNLYLSPRGVRQCKICNRANQLLYEFGVSYEEYTGMLKSQNGCCAICKVYLETPHVDHDHETEQVRGLLCRDCNLALGYLQDDVLILESALAYLKKWKFNASVS